MSRAGPPDDLAISTFTSDTLAGSDPWTGTLPDLYAGSADLNTTLGAILNPNGPRYVAGEDSNMVLRLEPATRTLVERFVRDDLASPTTALFGANGDSM